MDIPVETVPIDLYRRLTEIPADRRSGGIAVLELLGIPGDDPALLRLLALGVLTEDPAAPGRYCLVEPLTLEHRLVDQARERALAKQAEAAAELAALQQRTKVLAELQAAYAHGRRSSNEGTHEYVTGIVAINNVLTQLITHARRELLTAQPTQRRIATMELGENRDVKALARGVATRTLYTPGAIADPEFIRMQVEPAVRMGAQVRVIDPPVPFLRMVCVDRTWLVTEARDPEPAEHDRRTHTAQALVTRDPAIVAAFIHNFERDWAQARPYVLSPSAELRNPLQDAVTAALKTGADYETIAKQLNITSRTVTKHATAHRTNLCAAPGFQHGYLMAQQEIADQRSTAAPALPASGEGDPQ